ncbi:uncharacterized protein JN550_013827 [Neoarthrinium moseri]|uniref:uncharacterized protein n=1 Tax=Neoarthrinium moseri TaxID=1658444 RepID=UPI001FDDB0F9|nr:uncharacterized protein JN550_013827 [Neoarthrinium moseri]KAI1856341.1 hypothetical protein JN550_013827 [Neoarthrinium moseri]
MARLCGNGRGCLCQRSSQRISLNKVEAEKKLVEVLPDVDSKLESIDLKMEITHAEIESMRIDTHSNDIRQWLASPDGSSNFNKAIKVRHPGSGRLDILLWPTCYQEVHLDLYRKVLVDTAQLSQQFASWRAFVQRIKNDPYFSKVAYHFGESLLGDQIIAIRNDLLEADIRNYVQDRVREHEGLSRWRGHKEIQDKIEASLLEKANGMFRRVSCQLDALEDCLERKALLKALQSLPQTLDETYERILANVPSAHIHHTRRILQFLTYSERPLRLEEAVDAIAVDVGEGVARGCRFDPNDRLPVPREITRYCSSLVVLISRQGRYGEEQEVTEIQLAHFSVKDYLTSDRLDSQTALYLQETAAHSSVAEVCLAYLLEFEEVETTREIKQVSPFAQYSARYWVSYGVVGEKNSEHVFKLVGELFLSRLLLKSWCRLYNPDRPWEDELGRDNIAPALYYASLIGLSRCGSMLLSQGADINVQGGHHGNALQAASFGGHREIVQLLLDKGADVNVSQDALTPLLVAARQGHENIVCLLLAAGANHRVTDSFARTAFTYAAIHDSFRVVDILLGKPGLNINTKDHWGATAISFAARLGLSKSFEKIATMPSINLHAGENFGRTSLWWAQKQGHIDIASDIVEHIRLWTRTRHDLEG